MFRKTCVNHWVKWSYLWSLNRILVGLLVLVYGIFTCNTYMYIIPIVFSTHPCMPHMICWKKHLSIETSHDAHRIGHPSLPPWPENLKSLETSSKKLDFTHQIDSTNRQPASPGFLVVFLNKCSWYFHVITQQEWNWLNNLSKEIDLCPNHLAACTEPHESCRFYKSSKTTKKKSPKRSRLNSLFEKFEKPQESERLKKTRSKALWHI